MSDANSPIVISPSGPPRIASPSGHSKVQCIITSPRKDFVEVRRHYNKEIRKTERCACKPPCSTSRLDYFSCGLELIGEAKWELVVLKFGEAALRTLEVGCQMKGMKFETEGLWFTWWRLGDERTGRVQVSVASVVKTPPAKFDLPWAVSRNTRIAVGFFGRLADSASERGISSPSTSTAASACNDDLENTDAGELDHKAGQVEVTEQMMDEATAHFHIREAKRLLNGKPRVDKGKPQKK